LLMRWPFSFNVRPAATSLARGVGQSFGIQCPHIIKARHVGPVLGQHQAAPGIDLTERHRGHAGTLQAQREAADSAK
jgi:hypothetical protein